VSSLALQHSQRLNVDLVAAPDPGDAFSTISVQQGGAGTIALSTLVDDWVAVIAELFNSGATTIDYAELWKYEPLSFEASFVSAYDIGEAGASATAIQSTGQAIYVFRTSEGGILKINLMESVVPGGYAVGYSVLTASQKAVVDFVLSLAGGPPFLGRDTSYPFAFIRLYPGQNEAVYKKRYRSIV
jgi:hypothetical protein